jgi:molybdate transport system permease protein
VDESLTHAISLSAELAAWTVILHVFTGVLFAWLLLQQRWWAVLVDWLVMLPLIFPPIVLGFALLFVLGRQGWIGSSLATLGIQLVFSFQGLLLGAWLAGLPLIVKTIEAALRALPKSYTEAAYSLGYSSWQTFWWVLLPNVKLAVMVGLLLALGRSIGEVGLSLMLGGNILGETETVSLAIYNRVMSGDTQQAAWLSLGLGLVSATIFMMMRRISKRMA